MLYLAIIKKYIMNEKIRIGSLEHLNQFGDYDPKEKMFHLEIGSDAYIDYMGDFFDGYLEDEELEDVGYEQWINDIEAAVKEFYNPEAIVQLY